MLEAGDSSSSVFLSPSVVLSDVVTTPDCNCLYPKATPSSDLTSASPQPPLAPSVAPLAGLPWADSEGTEDSSLLRSGQPLRTEDPGLAKQRPPRSTCQTLESPETPGAEGGPVGGSPEPQPSVGAPVSGMEDVLDSVLSANWALEEASGEASEGPAPRGPEPSPSRLGGGSVQAAATRHSNLISASPLRASAKGQPPADGTGTLRPKVGSGRPTGQARSHTPEKTDRPSLPPRDAQAPDSARPQFLRPRGLSRPSTLSAQARLPGSHAWDSVLPLGGPQGRRSTRERRSTAGLEGGPSEGVAAPHAHFNPVPLTDIGGVLPPSTPQAREIVRPVLVPSAFLVLLVVGGLLLCRWRRRRVRARWWPRGGHLLGTVAQRVEEQVQAGWLGADAHTRKLAERRGGEMDREGFFKTGGSWYTVSGRAGSSERERTFLGQRHMEECDACAPGHSPAGRRRGPSMEASGSSHRGTWGSPAWGGDHVPQPPQLLSELPFSVPRAIESYSPWILPWSNQRAGELRGWGAL